MKNGIFACLLAAAVLFSFLRTGLHIEKEYSPRPPQIPSDWFIDQRIYPYGNVDDNAYHAAIQQALTLRQTARLNPETQAAIWQFAGPVNVGGRLTDVEMHPSSQQIIYIGAASGGVFKSTDQGITWIPLFDNQPSLSIGDIAIAPSDPNTIYVGTGECNNGRGSVTYDGQGVFKSTDAGATWTSVGLQNTKTTGRIAIHPTNANIVFAATMGDLFGNGPNRGLYRTTDGGLTWSNVLFVNDSTGAVEVLFDPSNPNTLYATTWTRIRRPTYVNYGGAGSNIYKSVDGGTTWTMLTNGLPANNAQMGRIGIDIAAGSPQTLYAVYAGYLGAFSGMYKTTNGGASWAPVTGNNFLLSNMTSSAFYWYGRVKVDPTNANNVYICDLSLWKSTNGGGSWNDIGSSFHVDQHSTYVHPNNSNLVLQGHDGGINISTNGGSSWTNFQNIPVSQFYTCEIDYQNPTNLYGGMQDNGTAYTPTGNLNDWQTVYWGDGFYVLVDPNNPANQIYEYQYGNLSTGMSGIDMNERSNWMTPIVYNPQNTTIVFHGRQKVYKSTNSGYNWTAISPDLTAGPQTGNQNFHTITTLSCSGVNPNIIYAGCDDGNAWVTLNGGTNWTPINSGLPVRWITRFTADPSVQNRVFCTVSGFRWHEYTPHILMSNTNGSSWTDISSNLPQAPVNDVIVDPSNNNILYVATDLGVYYSTNLGGSWQAAGSGMPIVPVNDLVLHGPTRKLVAGTYGRSQWTLDLNQLVNVDEEVTQTLITAYPNPTTDFLQIQTDQSAAYELRVYDGKGRLMISDSFKGNTYTLHRGTLANGIYLAEIRTGNRTQTLRLVFH
ncbi:MAG: T9SS type A sorting domain-containing protein [Bacteroidia bacterium]|nr:T9SS type A sorting domain-containing protein [Bacteroidia bacterium]